MTEAIKRLNGQLANALDDASVIEVDGIISLSPETAKLVSREIVHIKIIRGLYTGTTQVYPVRNKGMQVLEFVPAAKDWPTPYTLKPLHHRSLKGLSHFYALCDTIARQAYLDTLNAALNAVA